jgi:hypothetical protein
MQTETVLEAARLIDQLHKLDDFLKYAPEKSDTLTITFRDGKYSKSLSLKDGPTITNIRSVVEKIRDDTRAAILDLGVEL